MYSKADIFNLALGALLLNRRITDPSTDTSNECSVLNTHWNAAYLGTLGEMNLDSTAETVTLALVTQFVSYDISGAIDGTGNGQINPWLYAYKYPTNCAFLRRIVSCVRTDNRYTLIDKRVGVYQGQKVIYTNQDQAMAEIIGNDVPLSVLSAAAGLAVAYKLAWLAAPLNVGKGAKDLREEIVAQYKIQRAIAQGQDRDENFVYEDDFMQSELVAARMS